MKVFFRADASISIGSGHVMRCLTLAEELTYRRCSVTFICRELPGNLIELIKNTGYPVYKFPRGGVLNWQEDAEKTLNYMQISDEVIDYVVVDHYELDSHWESVVRKGAKKIMVIDDLANRTHDCDILLDQNYYFNAESRYKKWVSKQSICLLGPKYALLRSEFDEARKRLRQNNDVSHILISFGGVDPHNLTTLALHAIISLNRPDISVDVVVGESNSYREYLSNLSYKYKQISLHVQTKNMAELMVKADLAIGGGGSTSWERCALGLPSVVISLANNQTAICKGLAEKSCALYLGGYKYITVEKMSECLKELINNPLKLNEFRNNASELVDGRGRERVSLQLMAAL